MDIVVCLDNVEKKFRTRLETQTVKALSDLSFTVSTGDVFGIVGTNGAGKSTTLKILMGFVRPDKGSVLLSGRSPEDSCSHAVVGYLPENPCLYRHLTIYDHFNFAGAVAGYSRKEIKEQIPQVDSFLVYVAPSKQSKFVVAIPVQEDQLLKSKISRSFSHSRFFALVTLEKGKISSLVIKRNPYQKKTLRAGLSVSHYLIKHRVNVVLVPEIGPIAFHILGDNLIQIYQTKEGTLAQAIQDFLDKKLSLLSKPTTKKN